VNFLDRYPRATPISNFMKRRPLGAEFFLAQVDGWTDVQTDITKLIFAVRSFANGPETGIGSAGGKAGQNITWHVKSLGQSMRLVGAIIHAGFDILIFGKLRYPAVLWGGAGYSNMCCVAATGLRDGRPSIRTTKYFLRSIRTYSRAHHTSYSMEIGRSFSEI